MIFYESPHKLLKTLTHFGEYFGTDRQISVSRELTKLFEETKRGDIAEVFIILYRKACKRRNCDYS